MSSAGWFAGFSLLALALPSAPAVAAIEYDFVYVDAFQSDYDLRESYLFGINDHGQACGWATDVPSYSGYDWSMAVGKLRIPFTYARGINEAGQIAGLNFVFDRSTGTTTTIPIAAGAVASPVALDINDLGVVVGYDETCICSNSDRVLQIPLVWDRAGGSRTIPVAGAKELVKINNLNVAVGNIRGGSPDGFVYDLTTGRTIRMSTFFSTNPYPWTEASAINDRGMVTGRRRSDDAQSFHGYVWTEQSGAVLLPHIGGQSLLDVWPWALNESGRVVGMAEIADHVWRAFVWDASSGIRDLNSLAELPAGFILDRATQINDRGWIVGDGHFGPNWSSSQAFVLIPRTENTLAVPPFGSAGVDLELLPNPARGPVFIDLAVPSAGTTRIEVFDLTGRRVARIMDERVATSRSLAWDARGASGQSLAAGTYLVRLEWNGQAVTRRLTIMR